MGAGRRLRQLSLARGGGAGREVENPIFTTRAVSGARDTPPYIRKLLDERASNQ